ncbi:MAG: NTP transferase domain-containing protein [bacterium]|nr:NTP transferase domain-containing protein [bacterium]
MGITAIIPAAGIGTRLRPHTFSLPKALLPVAGNTVLGHILDQLVAAGVDRVVLVVGYLGEQLTEWVQSTYPDLRVDTVHQAERLGLGHAIYQALEGADLREGRGLVILGDTVVKADFAGLLAAPGHAMGVKEVADPRRFGVAVTEGERIIELEEKPEEPRSNLAMVGLYAFSDLGALHRSLQHIITGNIRTRGEFQLTDALQRMIEEGEYLSTFPIQGWFDVGKEESWLETNRDLLAHVEEPAPREGVIFHPPVHVPDSAELSDCEIGPNVSLEEGVKFNRVVIENSIVGTGVVVTDCAIRDSLIGANSRLIGLKGCFNLGENSEAVGE